jgi:nucleotide-binding universal stress UspA family protein
MKALINNVLVAVSGSDASINAAKYGVILARQYKCNLHGVYVIDTATLRQLVFSRIFIEDESLEYERSLETNGERYLNYVKELSAQKGVKMTTALRRGSIYSEILKESEERASDLIILGGWERDRQERDIISQSHRDILLHARCSVLVAKEQDIDRLYKQL